jgi:hypothetical protein
MNWLRLVWWILWRSLVCSVLIAILVGGAVAGRDGAELGALFGIVLGVMIATLNVPLIAAMTRLYIHRPQQYGRGIVSARIVIMVIDCIPVLLVSLALFRNGVLSFLPPILTIIAIYLLSLSYIKLVDAQMANPIVRKPKLTIPL